MAPKPTWSSAEIEFLRANAATMTKWEISQHLQRSVHGVQVQARKYGIKIIPRSGEGPHTQTNVRHWTKSETLELMRLAEKCSRKTMAKKLKRSEYAIQCRCTRLGITLRQARLSIKKVAEELGVDRSTITRVRRELGMKVHKTAKLGLASKEVAAIARHLRSREKPSSRLGASARHLKKMVEFYEGF